MVGEASLYLKPPSRNTIEDVEVYKECLRDMTCYVICTVFCTVWIHSAASASIQILKRNSTKRKEHTIFGCICTRHIVNTHKLFQQRKEQERQQCYLGEILSRSTLMASLPTPTSPGQFWSVGVDKGRQGTLFSSPSVT